MYCEHGISVIKQLKPGMLLFVSVKYIVYYNIYISKGRSIHVDIQILFKDAYYTGDCIMHRY